MIDKRIKEPISYRSGTGIVIMLVSTKKVNRGGHFTIVVVKNSDAKLLRGDNLMFIWKEVIS